MTVISACQHGFAVQYIARAVNLQQIRLLLSVSFTRTTSIRIN